MSGEALMPNDRRFRAWLAAIAAAATAPVAGALIFSAPAESYGDNVGEVIVTMVVVWIVGSILAVPHLMLAMPVYTALRRRGGVNWFTAGLIGALIGAVPLPLVVLLGWGELREALIGLCAVSGLVGGLAFRAALGRTA